jgi:HlyD family secretion protein
MQKIGRLLIPLFVILIVIVVGVWYFNQSRTSAAEAQLQASGTVEAVQVIVSPEMAGRVLEVLVDKGDKVATGDLLFRLDDSIFQAQRKRAEAALQASRDGLDSAQTNLEIAQAGLNVSQAALKNAQTTAESAQLQYKIALDTAHQVEQPSRVVAWEERVPDEFNLPEWYFDKSEEITAATNGVDMAKQALEAEKANLDATLQKSSNADLLATEKRLAEAQTAFQVAKDVLDRAKKQNNKTLEDFAQSIYESARSELDAAQSAYDNLLSETAAKDVLEARARLSVAQERYDTAQDYLNALLTGEDSLRVQAAEIVVRQAEDSVSQAQAAVTQAEAGVKGAQSKLAQSKSGLAQAQAELDLIDVQLEKMSIYSAVSGTVITRSIEPGEVIQPGGTALTIGELSQLTITVYLPEDRYGDINLGDEAQVTVDSFPGEKFIAVVTGIADTAEFTPRNVQTVEGRKTTVFAIELTVQDPQGKLKPGMPSDVKFGD